MTILVMFLVVVMIVVVVHVTVVIVDHNGSIGRTLAVAACCAEQTEYASKQHCRGSE